MLPQTNSITPMAEREEKFDALWTAISKAMKELLLDAWKSASGCKLSGNALFDIGFNEGGVTSKKVKIEKVVK